MFTNVLWTNYYGQITKNENDLTLLQLKIKDVIVDLKKVKDMTELQNRKLYVSE